MTLGVLRTDLSTDEVWMIEPFPSWVDNRYKFRSVLGFEIDRNSQLWVTDQGRTNGGPVAEVDAVRVRVYDLLDENRSTMNLVLNPLVAPPQTAFINDIVVDADLGFAYLTDSGIPATNSTLPARGGLIVVAVGADAAGASAWRVLDSHVSVQPDPQLAPVVENVTYEGRVGADSLALCNASATLVFAPLSSRTLYAVPTFLLRDPSARDADLRGAVVALGPKGSISDGFACDRANNLYISSLEDNTVRGGSLDLFTGAVPLPILASDVLWPDTFGFDNTIGSVLVLSNRLDRFLAGALDFQTPYLFLTVIPISTSGYGFRVQPPSELEGPFVSNAYNRFEGNGTVLAGQVTGHSVTNTIPPASQSIL